ncbi:MAG: hypothetical protein ABSF26_25405 [Thermoguttaceae bacterium]
MIIDNRLPNQLARALVAWLISASALLAKTPDVDDDFAGLLSKHMVWVTAADPVGAGASIKAAGAKGQGLTLLLDGSEGKLANVNIDGKKAWQLVSGNLVYVEVAPWFAPKDVVLAIEYYDAVANKGFSGVYDSYDRAIPSLDGRAPHGVWRGMEGKIVSRGSKTWQRGQLRLPMARFSRECNGGDLRLNVPMELPIRALWLEAANAKPEPFQPRAEIELAAGPGKAGKIREAKPGKRFTLVSGDVAVEAGVDGLFSVSRRAGAIGLMKAAQAVLPFEVTVKKGRAKLDVDAAAMPVRLRVEGDNQRASALQWSWGTRTTLQLGLRLEAAGDGIVRMRLTRFAAGEQAMPLELEALTFPSLPDLAVGGNPHDDWYVAPGYANHGAGVYYAPVDAGAPNMYPTAVNWLDLSDTANGGIGLILDDRNDLDVGMNCGKSTGGWRMGFRSTVRTAADLPHALLVAHAGDWHATADVYREQVAVHDKVLSPPDWFRYDNDGYATPGDDTLEGFASFPDYWQRTAGDAGLGLANFYRVAADGPWCYCGVYPYPNPQLGPLSELKEAVARIHDRGGRAIFYVNHQLTLPDGRCVKRICAMPRSQIPEDIPPPFYPKDQPQITDRSFIGMGDEELQMDRGSRAWSDRNLFFALLYAREVRADGIYWDQLQCCGGGLHETTWNMRRIMEETRKIQPGFVCGGEGVGQPHQRSADFGIGCAVFHRTELFRYTLPQAIVLDGSSNGGCNWSGKELHFNSIFLNGCRFDGLSKWWFDEDFCRKTMALRKATKQLLYPAVFKDTAGVTLNALSPKPKPGLQVAMGFGVQATRFVLDTTATKAVLVNCVNVDNAQWGDNYQMLDKPWLRPGKAGVVATVEVGESSRIAAAFACLWGGVWKPWTFNKVGATAVSFPVPATNQATVVLVERCEPMLYPQLPKQIGAGATVTLAVEVLNLDAKPFTGRIGWALPADWKATAGDVSALAPGQRVTVTTTLTAAANAPRGPADLWCVAEAELVPVGRRYVSLPVVNTPWVDWSWQPGERVAVHLRNRGPVAVKATAALEVPQDAGFTAHVQPDAVNLAPGADQDVSLTFAGRESQDMPAFCTLVVKANGRDQRIPWTVYPRVANGGFELDLAGDGKPEGWLPYDYSGKLSIKDMYLKVHVDARVKHGGDTSLRLDPPGAKDAGVYLYPLMSTLAPKTRYRITAWLRQSQGGEGGLLCANQMAQPEGKRGADGWQQVARVITTGDRPGLAPVCLFNKGSTPIWFDDLNVVLATE